MKPTTPTFIALLVILALTENTGAAGMPTNTTSMIETVSLPHESGSISGVTTRRNVTWTNRAGIRQDRVCVAVYSADLRAVWVGPEMEGFFIASRSNILFVTKGSTLQFHPYSKFVATELPPAELLATEFDSYQKSLPFERPYYSVHMALILGLGALTDIAPPLAADGKTPVGPALLNRRIRARTDSVGFDSTNIVVSVVGETGIKSKIVFRPDLKPIFAETNGVPVGPISSNCVMVLPHKSIRPEWLH